MSIRRFILKGKESMIDHVKSVNEFGCIYWVTARNKNMNIGDICYLFLSGKDHNQIRYRLEVIDTNCMRDDKCCWHIPFVGNKPCYKLIPTAEMYQGNDLSREDLEAIGINRYVQYKELNDYQISFIDSYFQ
ncbi:MAG: hypothetical protein IKY82_03470 [Alistipes sp.]|nr:hypothetical protein [Alistipes sp.]